MLIQANICQYMPTYANINISIYRSLTVSLQYLLETLPVTLVPVKNYSTWRYGLGLVGW